MIDEYVSIAILRRTLCMLINELYPDITLLSEGHYFLDDILDQLIFEIIKEEYKAHAERHTIQHYLELYDTDHQGTSRKYTRAVQYSQHYRDLSNQEIESLYGFRLSELEPQNMSGSKRFAGHRFTGTRVLGIKDAS